MIRSGKKAGFTLIELMIVVAIIAIIASIAIPKLMAARLTANESAAIATLRSLSSAQAQLQSSGAIDTDGDGSGEYGYFGELSGVDPMRINNGMGAIAAGVANVDNLSPAVMSTAFGNVAASRVTRSGYTFQIFLPNAALTGAPEGATGGAVVGAAATEPGSNAAEIMWCAYAWPVAFGQSGNRVFFVNQEGELLSYNNRVAGTRYTAAAGPAWNAAYTILPAADMTARVASGVAGVDMNIWVPVPVVLRDTSKLTLRLRGAPSTRRGALLRSWRGNSCRPSFRFKEGVAEKWSHLHEANPIPSRLHPHRADDCCGHHCHRGLDCDPQVDGSEADGQRVGSDRNASFPRLRPGAAPVGLRDRLRRRWGRRVWVLWRALRRFAHASQRRHAAADGGTAGVDNLQPPV